MTTKELCFECHFVQITRAGRFVEPDIFICGVRISRILIAHVVEARHRDEHTNELQARLNRANQVIHDKGIVADLRNKFPNTKDQK